VPVLDQDAVTATATAGVVYDGADSVRLAVRNNSTDTVVFLGNSGVTAANGWPLNPGDGYEWPIRVDPDSPVYAVTASGTVDLRWMALT
jgi:hypothetical protein